MGWRIERIINFKRGRTWREGFAHFGFHDGSGNQYVIDHENHWIALLGKNERFIWSAGTARVEGSDLHITVDLQNPMYIADAPDGTLLVSNLSNKKIHRIDPARGSACVFVDGESLGLRDMGNCVFDLHGNIWVNEVEGSRIWQFDSEGTPIHTLGSGTPGFQSHEVPFDETQFGWIYDIRRGPDGNIYVLDSTNFAVRMIDLHRQVVSLVAGTGKSGYSGDGGDALSATFGSNPTEHFDGPYSLSLDEEGNVFVGDTQNHVVRMIERSTNTISTIAGSAHAEPGRRNNPAETNPFKLNLPKIGSMDYYRGRLFVPEDEGDLIVLART